MVLATPVRSCCSVEVNRRSPLNYRGFPAPPVLTSVISRSFPRKRNPDAARNPDRLLTIPDGYLRCGSGLPVVRDDGVGPLRQLFLLAAGETVIAAVPSHTPDLDAGDQLLLTANLQGNTGSYPLSVIRIACRQAVIDTRFFIDSLRCSAIPKIIASPACSAKLAD